MKICVVGLRGIPNVMGGIESHCQQLYPRIVNRGAEVVILGRSPYLESKIADYQGVTVNAIWAIKHKFFETFLHTFFAIIYARLVIRPDVIHLHAIGPGLFTPLARLLGMSVVVTHHGADYDRQKWNGFAKWLLTFGERMSVVFGKKVLVVGETLTGRLKIKYPKHAEKIIYVPNGAIQGFDNDISEEDLPKDIESLNPDKYILSVGRLVPEKGFHDLVEAFCRSNTGCKLILVGKADHDDDYSRNLIKMQSDNVVFAGRREGKQLAALYKYATLFVLPSYHEGLPIVALEALSADTDVLLSNIEPNKDIGLSEQNYFRVGDIDDLASKLSSLDNLELDVDAQEILIKFNWDEIAESTLSEYEKLVV
jgi:glycosyltransferase involved in cell wall biosynthesis